MEQTAFEIEAFCTQGHQMNPETAQYCGKQIYHVNSALHLKQQVPASEQEAKPKPQIQNTPNVGKLKSAAGASCKQNKHQHFRPASQPQTLNEGHFPRHQATRLTARYMYSPFSDGSRWIKSVALLTSDQPPSTSASTSASTSLEMMGTSCQLATSRPSRGVDPVSSI